MARKTIVQHEDGTVSTRTSTKAVYTHAVVLDETATKTAGSKRFGVVRWATRADLAHKAAAEWTGKGFKVYVVEVEEA